MSRFFTISLLLLGLGLAAFDGFRDRERSRATAPTTENGTVHASDLYMPPK